MLVLLLTVSVETVLPKLARPKSLPSLVDEDGGGGFSICEAVGARAWRIEYVRCILAVICGRDVVEGGFCLLHELL